MRALVKVAPRDDERPSCPFCKEELAPAKTTACDRCGTAHHVECARELSRCTVFGCGGSLAGKTVAPVASRATRPAWWAGVGELLLGALQILGVIIDILVIFA